MGRPILYNPSQVCLLRHSPLATEPLLTPLPEPMNTRTVSDWLSTFLADPHPYYHGEEDDYDESIPDGVPAVEGDEYYDHIDEGMIESLIIVGLAAALVWLIYYRQQRALQGQAQGQRQGQDQPAGMPGGGHGQEEDRVPEGERLPGQQADGGFFPPPDDPAFGPWVAGGVGH